MEKGYRITSAPTADLAKKLNIFTTREMDDALAQRGYVRLDLGDNPDTQIEMLHIGASIVPDDGHRAMASRLIRLLLHVAHGGRPSPEKIIAIAGDVLAAIPTDNVGAKIVSAISARYALAEPRVPEPTAKINSYAPDIATTARLVASAAVENGSTSDAILERAIAIGSNISGWESMIVAAIGPRVAIRLARRKTNLHENQLLDNREKELASWLMRNASATRLEFENYAKYVGLKPYEAAIRIHDAIGGQDIALIGGPETSIISS